MNTHEKACLALGELRREKSRRQHVYPRLIAHESLRETQAETQMRHLDFAIELLEDVLTEHGQQTLFGKEPA